MLAAVDGIVSLVTHCFIMMEARPVFRLPYRRAWNAERY